MVYYCIGQREGQSQRQIGLVSLNHRVPSLQRQCNFVSLLRVAMCVVSVVLLFKGPDRLPAETDATTSIRRNRTL